MQQFYKTTFFVKNKEIEKYLRDTTEKYFILYYFLLSKCVKKTFRILMTFHVIPFPFPIIFFTFKLFSCQPKDPLQKLTSTPNCPQSHINFNFSFTQFTSQPSSSLSSTTCLRPKSKISLTLRYNIVIRLRNRM